MTNSYRPDVDGLRTVAVMSVLLYHLGISAVSGGFVGVDVFFVISGFLITRKIVDDVEAGHFSFSEFYLARVRRIFPALVVTVALVFVASALVLSPGVFQEFARTAIASVLSVSNVLFWMTSGYFDADSSLKPLLHTWSLGVEEQFYLIWPLALVVLYRWGTRKIAVTGVVFLLVVSFAAAVVNLESDPSGTFFMLPFRMWELAIGGLLAFLPRPQRLPAPLKEVGLLAGLGMIVVAATAYSKTTPFPGLSAALPVVGAALAIYFGEARFSSHLLTNPLSVGIGKISYSLYLVHWPMIVLTKYVLMRALTAAEMVQMLVACLLLAYLMYRFVEQPFRRRGEAGFRVPGRAVVAAVAIMSVAIVAPAYSAWSQNGWPWRLGERAAILDGIKKPADLRIAYYGGKGCPRPICFTSPDAKRKVYLVGDSHARALHAGLVRWFPDTNFVIVAPDACPLYTTVYGLHKDINSKGCLAGRKLAFKEISRGDAPVLLTQHWAARVISKHFRDDGNGDEVRYSGHLEFAKFVGREIEGVKALIKGQPLVVLGGLPRYAAPSSPLDCISRPYQTSSCDRSRYSNGTVAEHLSINRALSASLAGKVGFLDPFDFLCRDGECRNFDDEGRTLYADTTHLTGWGAEFLVERMKPALAKALGLEGLSKPLPPQAER